MDKIAIISDIHSNIVALKSVLKDIESRNINKIYCLGDIVLKGSSPCDSLDLIRQKCDIVIKGNCDDYAVNLNYDHAIWYKNKLGSERIEYLNNLPMYKDLYISGSLVRLFHATKTDLNKRTLDTATIEEKLSLFEDENNIVPDIIFYGDIHKQYLEKIKNKTIVNVGSIGNTLEISNTVSNDDEMNEMTQAHYCIVEGNLNSKERSSLSINFVRVPYNIEEELKLARNNKTPDYNQYEEELLKAKYRGKDEKILEELKNNK